jgi:hypothetical protein
MKLILSVLLLLRGQKVSVTLYKSATSSPVIIDLATSTPTLW